MTLVRQRDGNVLRARDDVIVSQDLAVRVDNEAGPDALLRKHLEEEIALIHDTRDIHRSEAIDLIDIDIVLLVRAESGAVSGHGFGPELSVRRDRLNQLFQRPVPALGNEPEAADDKQGENERPWFHEASLLRSLYTSSVCRTVSSLAPPVSII